MLRRKRTNQKKPLLVAGSELPALLARPHRRDHRGVTFDLLAVVAALVLVGLGLANLVVSDGAPMALRQAVVAVAGVVVLALFWRFRVRLLTVLGAVSYVLAVALMGVVAVAGVTANGATRWIDIGPFTFQPSELAKLGLLVALAGVLGSARPDWQRLVLALALAAVPIALTLLQPDLSTALVMIVLTVAMLVMGRVPGKLLLPLLAAAALLAPLGVGLLRPHQMQRLGSFLVGTQESPTGAGYAVEQARISLGSGGPFGWYGNPLAELRARYLPERETDLALSGVVEQFGLVAGGIVVLAAIVLVWRIALAARQARNAHGALVCAGLAVLFGTETLVSVGGNLGLLPLAGIPFPLLSYGGSALLVKLAALGVALGIRHDGARKRIWALGLRRRNRPRLVRAVALGTTAVLAVFSAYGVNLQAVHGPELLAAAEDQMTRCIRIPAQRGAITDRHGTPVAFSTVDAPDGVDEVIAVPALLRTRPDDVARVAAHVGRPAEEVQAQLDAVPATTLSLKLGEVPHSVGAHVAAAGIDGVMVVPEARRYYPTGSLLAPVLGFAGVATEKETQRWPDLPSGEIVGRAGLELQYDAVLRGVNGRQCVYVDPTGVPVAMGPRYDPVPGSDLRLSIDLGLQRRLGESLQAAMRAQSNPKAVGAALAMDARTGQVLAMASVPSYDNNAFGPPPDPGELQAITENPNRSMRNAAIQAAVPPGSTFKLVVAAADAVDPVIPPEQVIPTGADYTVGGHTFRNWKPMGPMDMVDSIAWSNDVYFYKLAQAMGPEPIIETARALGVGAVSGIDLPGESAGYLGTPESVAERGGTWYGGSTVILGIGQGYLLTTPIQVARWTAGIATGQMVTPRLGLAVGTSGGPLTALPAPQPTALSFTDVLGPVREGMRAVVTSGTATALGSLPAAGKTGTAQDNALAAGTYHNWMTAVAPHDDPRVVVTALVQGPGGGANSAKNVVADGLRHFLDHQGEVLATDLLQSP